MKGRAMLFIGVLTLVGCASQPSSPAKTRRPGNFGVCVSVPKPPVIYMIGDSTMSVYADELYPRMGWGQALGGLFAPACATVADKALPGRSSKSFLDERAWAPIEGALRSGDYVLIQFGHNDEKGYDSTRYTSPQTTYKQYLTRYVGDARRKDATPILLTSIQRNLWADGKISNSHGDYPLAVRELAVSLHVELIDLSALTKVYFERIGQAETTKLFMVLAAGQFRSHPDGLIDNTHLQERGARAISQLAMSDAFARRLSIASYLMAPPAAP